MVTLSLRVPLYSGCSLKHLVVMLLASSFAAWSSVGRRTSHVAKLLRQKYWHGMPAFLNNSSNVSFFSPTNLLVLRSETTSERILGVHFFFQFRDGQNLVAFEVLRVLLHPIPFVVGRSPLLALPRCGALLGWLYWAVLSSIQYCSLRISGDRQRWPIRAY